MDFIENDLFKISKDSIDIKDQGTSIPLLGSHEGNDVLIIKSSNRILPLQVNEVDSSPGESLSFTFTNDRVDAQLTIEIMASSIIHFKHTITARKSTRYSSVLASFAILMGRNPDFTWVPYVRPRENLVIGDHVFRSPVIIYKKERLAFALIPDLELFRSHRTAQQFMDFDLKPGSSEATYPEISYGFGNYKPVGHILFKHNRKKQAMLQPGTSLVFGYHILIFKDVSASQIMETINEFLWEKYGHIYLFQDLSPQVLPFDTCVDAGFDAIERHGCWCNFTIDGTDCGGIFNRSWMGKKKQPFQFIKPGKLASYRKNSQNSFVTRETFTSKIIMYLSSNLFWVKWFDKFMRNHAIMKRVAEIQNNAWFLNIRTAYALKYFGSLWNQDFEHFIDRCNRIVNTVMRLPRKRGLFPSVIFPFSANASEITTINGLKAFSYTDDFCVVDSCLAMYWVMKIHHDFDEIPGVMEKSKQLFDLIEETQLDNGAIPAYVGFEHDDAKLIIRDTLIDSASSGAPLVFVMEYYKISNDERCIDVGRKIADYLRESIIPENKWHDFEPFFSCTHLPLDFYDPHTMSHVMNTLCIHWCAEGLKEFYKATGDKAFLESGKRALAALSLFQQVWNMPQIGYRTYGGFCSQNADAELSDARQGLFVQTYMEYYNETGKKEYFERGIATLRACWALQVLKENEPIAPVNLAGIDTVDGVDRGVVFENFGHSGWNFRVPGYVMFDWGVGSSATATAYVKRHFGDIYIDFDQKLVWGIDAILVKSFEFMDDKVDIEIEKLEKKKHAILKAKNVPGNGVEIVLNGNSMGIMTKEGLDLILG